MAKRILFLANHFITLYSFRKELIQRLIEDGNEVFLSIPESEENIYFSNLGCAIVPTEVDRRGVNPIKDLKLIRFYQKMIPDINPDIIFSYTIKPNIYGTIASNRQGYCQVCNVTGTGATFLKKSLVSEICKFLYRHSVRHCHKVFFQNTGDRDFFCKNGMVKDNYDMLPGSGCNLEEHPYSPMPESDDINFIFIGRIMKLKGIDEYLACAEEIKRECPNVTFYVAGWNEEEEYKQKIDEYHKKGIIEYIGFRKDIDKWMAQCHCTVLPSHGGEGVPNVLLETAAAGRICIASRISGSTSVVEHEKTGYLFNVGDAQDLTKAVKRVIALSNEERNAMGQAGRKKVETEFDRSIVIEKYLRELEQA